MDLCTCDIDSDADSPQIRTDGDLEEGGARRSGDNDEESEGQSAPEAGAEQPPEDLDSKEGLEKPVNPIRMHRMNWYETTVRIRMTFYVFLSMAIIQSVCLSVAVHHLFSIMANPMYGDPMRDPALVSHILFIPLLLLFYAVITDLMVDVGLDGMATPSMSQWKSTVTLFAGACFESLSMRNAEIGFLVVFEGLPALYAFVSIFAVKSVSPMGKLISIINHYFQGGVWAVFLFVIAFLFARVYVQTCEMWEEDLAELYHSSIPLGHLKRPAASHATTGGFCSNFRPSSKHARCLRFLGYSGIAVIVDLLVLLIFMFHHAIAILLVGHLLVTVILVLYIRSRFPLLVGWTFWVMLAFYYAITFGLLGVANHHKTAHPAAPLCLAPSHPGYNQSAYDLPLAFTPPGNSQGYGYPVCSKHWGKWNLTTDDQFGVLDLAALTYASAYPTKDEVANNLHATFDGTALGTWNLTHVEPSKETGRWIVVDFPKQKARVIAVRGTSSIADMYEDLETYAGISVLEFMNLWTPVLSVLGDAWVRRIVNTAKPRFWDAFVDVVEKERRAAIATGSVLILTGHGLGAALAGVGAAKFGVQALGFSAPGLYYQAPRFGMDLGSLSRVYSNIQPVGDTVSTVDHQYGSLNWVKCGRSAADCHKLATTACELWSQCSDPRRRDFRQTCSTTLQRKDLNIG